MSYNGFISIHWPVNFSIPDEIRSLITTIFCIEGILIKNLSLKKNCWLWQWKVMILLECAGPTPIDCIAMILISSIWSKTFFRMSYSMIKIAIFQRDAFKSNVYMFNYWSASFLKKKVNFGQRTGAHKNPFWPLLIFRPNLIVLHIEWKIMLRLQRCIMYKSFSFESKSI